MKINEILLEQKTHKVSQGDNLWRISQTYGVTVDDLKKWNNLTSDTIKIGQELLVKANSVHNDASDANDDLQTIINKYAKKYDFDPKFITAIVHKESSFGKFLHGDKKLKNQAFGPMQVRKNAWQDVVRIFPNTDTTIWDRTQKFDKDAGVHAGVLYLAALRKNYGADSYEKLLAMFNGGPKGTSNPNALEYAKAVLEIFVDL
jgi:soluble lytic murein transglycosylase-like protein